MKVVERKPASVKMEYEGGSGERKRLEFPTATRSLLVVVQSDYKHPLRAIVGTKEQETGREGGEGEGGGEVVNRKNRSISLASQPGIRSCLTA